MLESARELLEKYATQYCNERVFLVNRKHYEYKGTVYRMNKEYFIVYKNTPIKVKLIMMNFWKEAI